MGSAYIDGSSVYDLDIYAAVNKCLDNGYKQEEIVVDALLTSGATLNKEDDRDLKSIGMLMRYLSIKSFYDSMDGVVRAMFAYKGVHFRYAVAP